MARHLSGGGGPMSEDIFFQSFLLIVSIPLFLVFEAVCIEKKIFNKKVQALLALILILPVISFFSGAFSMLSPVIMGLVSFTVGRLLTKESASQHR